MLPAELMRSGQLRVIENFQRAELTSILAEHDVGLFTSWVEGWGLCLNEMLESGMPVYATCAGGVVDLKPYFVGALRPFPPPTDADIDTRIPAADWKQYYGAFSWSRVARQYVRIISTLLESPLETGRVVSHEEE
jgi:glycosyltransferase involved in cell wall biosynthesis